MNIPPDAQPSQWIEPALDASADRDSPWAGLGRIYCITLRQRPDRRATVEAEFRRIGLGGRVTFLLAEKNIQNPEAGIFDSHQQCLRAGLAAGAERIAVFEDDVIIRHFAADRLAAASQFLQNELSWQALFFGCFVISSKATRSPAVRSIRYRCTAHAYVVRQAFAEQIVALPWTGVAYDDVLRALDAGHYFAIYPGFAFQSNSATDNDRHKRLDRVRRLFGGLHFGQRWDEFSHRNWRTIIAVHVAIVLTAGILLAIFKPWR